MAPNLPISRPLEEALVQPPKGHRSGGDHGPHSVISTYAKKEAFLRDDFPVRHSGSPSSAGESGSHKKAKVTNQKKVVESGELLSQEDDLLPLEDTVAGTEVPVSSMTTKPLMRHRPGAIVNLNLAPVVNTNHGFRPYDFSRYPPVDQGFQTYGVSGSPAFLTPQREILLEREAVIGQPSIRLPQEVPFNGLPPFNPAFRTTERTTVNPEPRVTTFRPKIKKHHKKSKGASTTSYPAHSSRRPPSDHPFYDPNYDFSHFEQELADFSNLYHHQKSLEELAKNKKDVDVREDWLLSGEGATAIILVGMCSIIMTLICLIFVMKKLKKNKEGDKMGDEIEEKRPPPAANSLATMWMDLYNPVNLIPQISFLHTLPQVDPPKKPSSPVLPVPSGMRQQMQLPFIKVDDFTETHLGRLWFSVRYETQKSSLHVNVRHARYPKGRGVESNTGELWVEGIVLSAMNTMKATSKTNTRRATQSPVFNHSFLFNVDGDEVESCILKLKLHDKHPKKEEQIVGSIILPLSSINLSSDEIHCRDLI